MFWVKMGGVDKQQIILYIDIEIKKGGVLMRQKLTKMTIEELEDYRQRWTKKLGKYQQGSKKRKLPGLVRLVSFW